MGWQPLESLGLGEYSFTPGDAGTSLTGSVVSNPDVTGATWVVSLTPSRRVRVTAESYAADAVFTTPAEFTWPGDGAQANINGQTAFAPTQWETVTETASLTYAGAAAVSAPEEAFAFGIEVWVDPPECDEYGRQTRAYVSGYNRSRVLVSRLYAHETRCLVADFNGAIPAGRTIVAAKWQTWQPWNVAMSAPGISGAGRVATVLIATQWPGIAVVKCTVTFDNGEIYTQQFEVTVVRQPWYTGDDYVTGPYEVVTP